MTRFRVARADLCGIQLDDEGTIDLLDGEVSGSPIGACLQDEYDVSRLTERVRYRDNGTNLIATVLPVPELQTR